MMPSQPNNPIPKPSGPPRRSGTATHLAPGPDDTTIVQDTTISSPPLPGIDAAMQPVAMGSVDIQAAASAFLEYISSTSPRIPIQFGNVAGMPGSGAGIHALPLYIDELERDFGTDIYIKILMDAVVKAADAVLRNAVLDRDPQISLGVDAKTETNPLRKILAERVLAFVEACMDHMEPSLPALCYELLEGISMGYKLAEQVYELADLDAGEGMQTVLKAVKCKPQEAVSFLVDLYNDTLGFIPRALATGMFATIMPESNGIVPGLVPVEKMVHFCWMPRNGDPRGTSHLRAAYIPWRFKIGIYPAYEAFLSRFAQPSAAIELQGADLPPMIDASGALTSDPTQVITAMLNALRNFQAGGATVVPVGTIKLLETMNQGQSYLQAFEHVNGEITKSILLQDLATNGPSHGTQALGEVHQDTMGLLVAYAKQVLAETIKRDIFRPLVFYNYGEAGLKVCPDITFGEIEQQDVATISGAAVQLANQKLVIPAQYNEILEMLHFPLIPQEIVDMMMAAFKQQLTTASQPPAPPQVGPDGQPIPPQPGQPGQPPPEGGIGQDPTQPDQQGGSLVPKPRPASGNPFGGA